MTTLHHIMTAWKCLCKTMYCINITPVSFH